MSDYITQLQRLQAKKIDGLRLADSYERLARLPSRFCTPDEMMEPCRRFRARAARIRDCGSYIKFGLLSGGDATLIEANFCRQRLCPACAFRRSLKVYGNISKVLDYVDAHDSDHAYFFLTLTVKNVYGHNLRDCLDMMSKGWDRFCKRRTVKGFVLGQIRTVEVTYSSKSNTYHPHYHVILALPKNYGSKKFDIYWNVQEWASVWARCCKLDYLPSVSIRRVRGLKAGIKETAKYAVKSSDWLSALNNVDLDKRVYDFTIGLHGKRLLSYGGIFADAKKALNILDDEQDDLTDEIKRIDVLTAIVVAKWSYGVKCYDVEISDVDN